MFGSTGYLHHEALIEHQRAQQQEDVCARFPAVLVNGHLVHVFEEYGQWKVWLNTEDMEFTGLCIAVAETRDQAVAQAVAVCEAVAAHLQNPTV